MTHTTKHLLGLALVGLLGVSALRAQQGANTGVTQQDIINGLKDPSRWLTFSGDYSGQRHSPLTQITPENVRSLIPQWVFQTLVPAPGRGFETTPLVLDGVLYITGNNNNAWAVDGRTGRPI